MALLLRAITPPVEAERGGVTPLARAELGRVMPLAVGGLTAWVTETEWPGQFTRQDLLDDHRIVEQLCSQAEACLPARFPTLFDDVAGLRAMLAQRAGELLAQLERVRGCCEIAVTAAWTSLDEPPSAVPHADTPGRRYLLQRQAQVAGSDRRHTIANQLKDEIERAAGAELLEARASVCPSGATALSMALLVRRAAAREVLGRLPRNAADVRILVHGPWPPYSFVGSGAGREEGDGRRTGGAQAAASARPGRASESDRGRP